MTPLEIVAHLRGAICLPYGPIALDGLLAAAVCLRDNVPPALIAKDVVPIEIPVEREPGGRFHLASVSHLESEQAEHRWLNRRFPIAEAQALGSAKLKRIRIDAGACKSYRIPLPTFFAKEDRLTWWCVGEQAEIADLLSIVHYIGKKRSVGLGAVDRWSVEPCEAWEGFPVLRNGLPLRPLPTDWPGLSDESDRAMARRTYPYWVRSQEEESAVPSWA